MNRQALERLAQRWEMRAACDTVFEAQKTWECCAEALRAELEACDV